MPARRRLVVVLTLLLGAFAAGAARAQSGINLAWNDCGEFGNAVKTFFCNTNAGSEQLFVSFYPPAGIDELVGCEVSVVVLFNSPIPPWWDFTSTGCRSNRLTASADFTAGPESCVDPWQGVAAPISNYQTNVPFPNAARMRAACALTNSRTVAVSENTEYYAVRLNIANAGTIGTACVGCDMPACLLLESVKLVQPFGVGDYVITNPALRADVTWQCPGSVTYSHFGEIGCSTFCPTPAKRESWGRIKSLFR